MNPERDPHILIVDDDHDIRYLLGQYLAAQEFRVSLAGDLKTFKRVVAAGSISLAIVDVMLPDGSGLDMCRDLRTQKSMLPIILLTALQEDADRITGLECGADDYLGKPFNPRELVARIRAVLRRRQGAGAVASEGLVYRFAGFELEPVRRRVTNRERQELDLTWAEFDLLHVLIARAGRLLSRGQLLEFTNDGNSDPFDRSIDVLMSRIRRKLRDGGGEDVITTVRNCGYLCSATVVVAGNAVVTSPQAYRTAR